jgi:phosphoserine phosphatase RsbX
MNLTVAHLSVPAQGEVLNGDRAYYRTDGARHLLAVVDGLGHGQGAHEASLAALEYWTGVDLSAPLHDLMVGAHGAMSGTRGAAATVCLISERSIHACAVGNVEVRSSALRIPLVTSPGVLGVRVQKFRTCEAPIEKAARLILFSDGISTRVRFEEHANLSPQELCKHVIAQHRRDYDDSTILVTDVEPSA